jgi:hypothetical protein
MLDDWFAQLKDLSCLKFHLEVFMIKHYKGVEADTIPQPRFSVTWWVITSRFSNLRSVVIIFISVIDTSVVIKLLTTDCLTLCK